MEGGDAARVVIVDYADIQKDDAGQDSALMDALERAFGAGSLGIIAISNVPRFVEQKQAFLPLGHTLAHLPQDYLEEELTDEASLYNNGWSYGKEKLGDEPDLSKGSFYFNPLSDQPGTEGDRAKFPLSYPCNIWPKRIPGFEKSAKDLGGLLKEVVVHVARHIDAFAKTKNPNYPEGALYKAMKETDKGKARLLYYFPLDDDENPNKEDSWLGWHNDSGFLTALAGELFVKHETGKVVPKSPDSNAGLYIVDRDDRVIKAQIPEDCMAVQIGECLQILTGGAVVATPHCVKASCAPGIARISLPCFIDAPPSYRLSMPEGCTREQVLTKETEKRVPPLGKRWTEDGMEFGTFLQKTFSLYYDWQTAST